MGDIYLWRQVFILVSNAFYSLSNGLMISFPSALSPALLSANNTDIEATTHQVSWIVTSNGIAGFFGFIVLSPILQIFGRRVVHVIDTLCLLIGWIIFTQAHSITAILAARIIHGFTVGGIYVRCIIVSEYADPKRRGYFMTTKMACFGSGIILCHALSLIWNWRQIAMFAAISPTLSIIMTIFWPESPYYLALKGRFTESKKAFVWLHGESNQQDLQLLHSSQLQKVGNPIREKWFRFLFKTDFLKPFAIMSLLILIIDVGGKHHFMVYVVQMMMELVGDKSLAIYYSLGVDLITVITLILSSFIIRYFKRRTILFCFGVITVILMLIISLVTIFKLFTMMWITPVLIMLHSFILNFSIAPVCLTLTGEILPLKYKGVGSLISGIVFTSLYSILLKLTSVLIENTGVGGVYAFYGITLAICLFLLYFLLPETKDRSLPEIENDFIHIEHLTCDENKRLEIIR